MDAIRQLPAPLRIGLPAIALLMVAFVVYLTMFKSPPPVKVISTKDVSTYETAMVVLDHQNISYTEARKGDAFELSVPASQDADAAKALAGSGLKDSTGLTKKLTCPARPGFTATRSANEQADNCADASSVQTMLLAAGAIAANVAVSQQANETLLGPEKSKNVVAQVFLPKTMDKWNAEQAGRTIARSVGTTVDRVIITDSTMAILFDGSQSATASAASTTAGSVSLGCDDIASATEVETKRAAVRSCYEGTIGAKLTSLLGGSDRYVLSVEPTIDSVARTTTSVKNTAGPATETSKQSGSGNSVLDTTNPPNTSETTQVDPAGDISSLRINVTLDKNVVTEDQRIAVVSMLGSFVDSRRGDPVPTVKLSKFANGAGSKVTNEDFAKIKEASEVKPTPVMARPAQNASLPAWAKSVMVMLVLGIVATVLLMWRRGQSIAGERARLEQSFQNEQRLFEDFAQQNPDHLARDLNALFGAPSAPERTY